MKSPSPFSAHLPPYPWQSIHLLLASVGSVQFSWVAQSCPTLWDPMNRSTSGHSVHHLLQAFTQTHVHWVSDGIQPSHPVSSPSPPAFSLSQHGGVFSNESALLIRWPKYWSFSFSISCSDEDSGLISFRIDWFDLRNSQESSPAPQFESISSSLLSLLGRNISARRAFPQEVTLIVGQTVHTREKLNRT